MCRWLPASWWDAANKWVSASNPIQSGTAQGDEPSAATNTVPVPRNSKKKQTTTTSEGDLGKTTFCSHLEALAAPNSFSSFLSPVKTISQVLPETEVFVAGCGRSGQLVLNLSSTPVGLLWGWSLWGGWLSWHENPEVAMTRAQPSPLCTSPKQSIST